MLEEELSFVKSIYANKKVSDDFEIRNWETYQTIEKIFSSWVK